MNPWLTPWLNLFKAPLSGNVTQDISPVTSWLSPQLEFNFAGDRTLETKIVSDIASYGKQLGILSEAVMELAEGNKGASVEKLKALTHQIESAKLHHQATLERNLKADLDKLKQEDPNSLKQILQEYS